MKASGLLVAGFASLAVAAPCSKRSNTSNFTVSMVRTYPPNWPLPLLSTNWTGIVMNVSQAVDKGVSLISEASANGADLVLFPELWFPGYPMGSDTQDFYSNLLPTYIDNCLVIGGEGWSRLVEAAQSAGIYTGFGFCERNTENIFMAQALISPSGDTLIQRHKLRPSGGERDIFSDGTMEMLQVVTTPYGRIGMLECYEHFWPSMTIPMQAQLENIHLSSFPYLVEDDYPGAQWYEKTSVNVAAEAHYAVLSGATVFHAGVGASWVIGPTGTVLAHINSSVEMDRTPLLYYGINTTSFNTSKTYDVNGQVSWGVVKQIQNGFPSYIPRDPGTFVDFQSIPISLLSSGNYNGTPPVA